MVLNEADIVGLAVLHNLSLGLDGVIVLDNGSTDGTEKVLRQLAEEDDRVWWTRDDSLFDQGTITTELAREALRRGADWVLPFDADEFWLARRGDFRSILVDSEAGALSVNPVNFVQARTQHESTPEALLSMTRRVAEPFPPGKLCRRLVESHQLGFVQMAYPPKWISRPTEEIRIGRGNHRVFGVKGKRAACVRATCLHAPLRSRALLESKVERSRRLMEAGMNPFGWHVSHWAYEIGQGGLEREWAANSYEGEHLHVYGKRYRVVPDFRLRNAVKPLVPRVSRIIAGLPS
jgi:hypothetical protein